MDWIADGIVKKTYDNTYVISSCSFAYAGFAALLAHKGLRSSRILFEIENISETEVELISAEKRDRITVFLLGDITTVLAMLKKLAYLLNHSLRPLPVLIFCHLPFSWVYRMMLSLVSDKDKLTGIRVGSSLLSCHAIMEDDFPLLSVKAQGEERISGYLCKGLSGRELDAVLHFYRGVPVKDQARNEGLSGKTIYNHRQEGLRKLQYIQKWLNDAKITRDIARNEPSEVPDNKVDVEQTIEWIFSDAIDNHSIFPVFQVITDHKKKASGFEILLRWRRNERVQKPAEFLTNLRNRNIWLKLTALVINAAVRGINRYHGKYYFTVNIPSDLAAGDALPRMAEKAVELLHNAEWADRLVFEFAEATDVTKDKRIPETMKNIRKTGCRLFLDDCFSSDQVMFPVRHIRFDGFKLDMDLVDKFADNDADSSLIKALLYYSSMIGSVCTAEGIDSKQKFDALAAMGMDSFQGFYLFEPVDEEAMDHVVRQFS